MNNAFNFQSPLKSVGLIHDLGLHDISAGVGAGLGPLLKNKHQRHLSKIQGQGGDGGRVRGLLDACCVRGNLVHVHIEWGITRSAWCRGKAGVADT